MKKAGRAIHESKAAVHAEGLSWEHADMHEHEVHLLQRFLVDTSLSAGRPPLETGRQHCSYASMLKATPLFNGLVWAFKQARLAIKRRETETATWGWLSADKELCCLLFRLLDLSASSL